jgi:hypothetical protein
MQNNDAVGYAEVDVITIKSMCPDLFVIKLAGAVQ